MDASVGWGCMPMPEVAFACGSASTKSTRLPATAVDTRTEIECGGRFSDTALLICYCYDFTHSDILRISFEIAKIIKIPPLSIKNIIKLL